MSNANINQLVDRFLAWPLPASVCSDPCACKRGYPNRIGTNLLTAEEAREMITHILGSDLVTREEYERVKAERDLSRATALELTTCDDALHLAESLAKVSIENAQLRAQIEAAEKALEDRLGSIPNAIEVACREYVRAEDALPEHFDSEDYTLGKAVESLAFALNDANAQLTAATQRAERAEAELEQWRKLATDPLATHLNLLHGKILLTREQALHFACATDYDQLRADKEKAEGAYLLTLLAIIESASTNEHKDLHYMLFRKTTTRIPNLFEEGQITPLEPVPQLSSKSAAGQEAESTGEAANGGTVSGEAGQRPQQVQGPIQKSSDAAPREGKGGPAASGPTQGECAGRTEGSREIRQNNQAREVSDLRERGHASWPSQRLQQALRCGVALQLLSREEAQNILARLSICCGKGYVSKEELHPTIGILRSVKNEFLRQGFQSTAEALEAEIARLQKLTETA